MITDKEAHDLEHPEDHEGMTCEECGEWFDNEDIRHVGVDGIPTCYNCKEHAVREDNRQRTGTETAITNCQGCGTETIAFVHHAWNREDAYGIPTGLWCDKCYNGDAYPFRKDDYFDPAYAGESLEED